MVKYCSKAKLIIFWKRGVKLNKQTVIVNDHQQVYEQLKDLRSWDYIDPMGMSVQAIEHFYQSMTLDVMRKKKDDYIEKKLHIAPSMVGYFYYFIQVYGRIPSQIEYIKFYYLANKQWVFKHVHPGNYHEAFFGRLSRFYPSMLRDIHFYHVLKESTQFEQVLFALKYDLEAKIDIFVKKKEQWYGIQLRTKTKRSNEFYEKKKGRNAMETKAILIDLPIDLSAAKSLTTQKDSVKLYDTRHVKQILTEIHTHETADQIG